MERRLDFDRLGSSMQWNACRTSAVRSPGCFRIARREGRSGVERGPNRSQTFVNVETVNERSQTTSSTSWRKTSLPRLPHSPRGSWLVSSRENTASVAWMVYLRNTRPRAQHRPRWHHSGQRPRRTTAAHIFPRSQPKKAGYPRAKRKRHAILQHR
jgi:hypothetical protein